MGVDHVDAVHIHNLGDFDMNRVFAVDGALALIESLLVRAAHQEGLCEET